jgi:hypothetical protein
MIRSNSSFRWTVNSAPRASGIRLQFFASGRHIIWPRNLSKMDMSKIGGDLHKRTLGRDRGVRIAYDGQNNQTFTSTKQPALKMARKTIPYDGDNNSDLFRAKRVAARHLSGFQACGEPASALLGCAMGEGIWYNITLALPLQSIIANG